MNKLREWFWTPARLTALLRVLDTGCERDEGGLYFGTMDLGGYVEARGQAYGLCVDASQARNGMHILVFLGGLEIGRRGRKNPNLAYRRRYYPQRVEPITWDDVNSYRQRPRKH